MIDTAALRAHHKEHGGGDSFDLKVFNHHNLLDEVTREAFVRRCTRFMDALRGEENVYLVYYNRNTNDSDELAEFVRRMHFRAGVTVIGIIKRGEGEGYGRSNEVIRSEEGLRIILTSDAEALMRYIGELLTE
jgi:hypothetical protein